MQHIVLFVLTVVLATTDARADMAGKPLAIDGDTIEIARQRIHLFGIEAPEITEICNASGRQWPCGQDAAFALAYETGGHWVTCRERGRLANGEIVGQCFAGPHDLSARMVSKGWARADRDRTSDYLEGEKAARAARIGIWRNN